MVELVQQVIMFLGSWLFFIVVIYLCMSIFSKRLETGITVRMKIVSAGKSALFCAMTMVAIRLLLGFMGHNYSLIGLMK